ncbi:uncharacterized protein LOC110652806 isoform X2 [Hevea brasiliensis]|uniref:uncharacterized protein LOC110652806 isoform X2 n=1 Tax=Hevea brasiliensis TaxID=3981 RepID=UPI0025E3475C|nr:uncharacterized protein LOC110652806 isoform X2 [Hevea brasiliensis]
MHKREGISLFRSSFLHSNALAAVLPQYENLNKRATSIYENVFTVKNQRRETAEIFIEHCSAAEFVPDFTIISVGFDAARGDPLGCCDMTHMLYTLSGGKLLVILEGSYNLRSISSSATEVIKKNKLKRGVGELIVSFTWWDL